MPPLTPLVRPETFFAERDLDALRVLVVVVVVIVATLGLSYAMGWILTSRIDGTVMVDNPDRPSDRFCESGFGFGDEDECDQPRKIEKNVDPLLWEAWGSVAGKLLIDLPIVWLLHGTILHAGSWIAGSENSVFPSYGIAAWGLVPSLVGGIVAVVVLYFTFDPITVTPANQDTALEAATSSLRVLQSNRLILTLLTAAWKAVIWRYGLEYWRDISGVAAWSVAGSVAAILVVFGLS